MGVRLSPKFPQSLNWLRKCRDYEYSWFRAMYGKCHEMEVKEEIFRGG